MTVARGGWSYRIIDGPVDLDVTAHVQGAPEVTWNAVGGCETATLRIDLPLSTFPTLGRRSQLIVTDHAGRDLWTGYCTDPGGVDDDAGEAFDLTADGSMVIAQNRVARLVYVDQEAGSWTRARGSISTGQTSLITETSEDYTGPVPAYLIAHPQGYVIGSGATVGVEYRLLEHSDQGIGRVAFTMTGGADDAGFDVAITTWADGVLVDTITSSLSDTPAAVDLAAGDDISTGCDVVRISLVRAGVATNNTSPLSFLRLTGLVLEGATVDQWGNPATPGGPMTSARIVADLIGRGMLGPVDPDAAVIDESAAVHTQLSWATGIRGSAALEALRADDPDMTWMYGAGSPTGYRFEWTSWANENGLTGDRGVRYDFTSDDTITSTGTTELPGDRVLVIWTDVDDEEHQLLVWLPEAADDEYARDLDPITLTNTTELAATEAGLDALTKSQDAGRTVTVTVSRQVLDRAAGLDVEPHELRPGCLARLEATGEILRVQTVTAHGGESGGTAELTLGSPSQTLEDRLLAVVRGEVDPTAPLVPLPPKPESPSTPGSPTTTDGLAPSESPDLTWQQGIGSLFLTWLPVANADPVEYRILIGTSPSLTESDTTLAATVRGTFFVARTLPSGAAFVAGTTYYARAIAADADGDAPAGDVASGTVLAKIVTTQITDGAVDTPQLNANAVDADYLIANDAWIGVLRVIDLTAETFTGPTYQTAASGNRLVIHDDGAGGVFEGWTGNAIQTTPATLNPQEGIGPGSARSPALQITSGSYSSHDEAYIQLMGEGSAGLPSLILLSANSTQVGGDLQVNGDIRGDSYGNTPIATVIAYLGSSVPTGWLLCDGSAVSRSTYSGLFGLVGTAWGSGNGSTTFNLPDFRDRALYGAGSAWAGVGTTDGLSYGTRARILSHNHGVTISSAGSHDHTISPASMSTASNTATGGSADRLTTGSTHNHSGSTGTDGSHAHSAVIDTTSPVLPGAAVNWLIRVA